MFWDSSDGIEEFTTSVTGFNYNVIDDVVPTVTVRTYPNQKPWIKGIICTELKARAATFKESDTNMDTDEKQSAMPFDQPSNRQRVNTGLRLNPTSPALILAINTEPCMRAPAVLAICVIMLSIANASNTFKQVNIYKATGPD
jgi:hypothetical protein